VTTTATSTPTVQPTPAPKAQAVTILAQGFGQETDGRQVGWAFMIENPNPGLAVESSQYQIALSDDSGTIRKTVSGYIGLLLPSEQTVVSGTTILPEGTKATKLDITFKQGNTGTLDVTGKFTADKVTYLANGYVPAVSGIISNPFNKDLENLRLSAVAYDESNKIIGSGYTFLNFILAGGKSGVTVSMTSSSDRAC